MAESVDLGSALRALLLADANVLSMIGQQCYSDQLPQTVQPPAVVYNIVSEDARDCLTDPLEFDSARVQIDCYGRTRGEANQLWQYARKVLAGFNAVSDGVRLQISQATGQLYFRDRPEVGTGQYRYRSVQDFDVNYTSFEKVA